MNWFDAHLDLAYLAVCGREMELDLNALRDPRPHPPAAVTLASLRTGCVRACLGTIFTEARPSNTTASYPDVEYVIGDVEGAHTAGKRQLAWYQAMAQRGVIELWGCGPVSGKAPDLRLGILIEGADVIRSPDELPWWVDHGAIAIGLTWARGSRYADGNTAEFRTSPRGLTPLGHDMVRAMDALNVVHDVSHLSHRAMDELLSMTDRAVIASHSNCLALLDAGNERHLRDDHIREIASRTNKAGACGVIGLNLCANFIRPGLRDGERPTIDDAIAHAEHICEVVGHRRAAGLGSDLDGGFSALHLPDGIGAPRDFVRLAEGLRNRGWNDAEVEDFAWGNWARFFALPSTL